MNAFAYHHADEIKAAHRFLTEDEAAALFHDLVALPAYAGGQFVPSDEIDAARALCLYVAQRGRLRQNSIDEHLLAEAIQSSGRKLDSRQAEAVRTMITMPLSLTTGGPGTGKSTIAAIASRYFSALKPGAAIACSAFSARAASAIASKCQATGFTLHSLTGVQPGEERAFGKRNLKPFDLIIVDEVFSADPALVLNILRSASDETPILLLGDPDQLPPVGYGRAIHELAELKALPHTHLTLAHRLGGDSHLAEQIRRAAAGFEPRPGPGLDIITLRQSMNAGDAAQLAARTYREHIARDLTSVVLTPTQYGLAGHRAINRLILGRNTLRAGDPVITTQACPNGRYRNGEAAILTHDDGRLALAFQDKTIEIDESARSAIQPSHAMSAHRAQGLEFDRVILVLTRDMSKSASRQLIVSAATRAPHCTIITERGCLASIVKRDDVASRPQIVRSFGV